MFGLAALAAWPAAVGLAQYSNRVGLIKALLGALPASLVPAVLAIFLARRARRRVQRTIGRSGRLRIAAIGRFLGIAGLCGAITGGLALGFYGLLQLFAS